MSLVVVNAAIPELIEGIPLVSKVLFNGNHRDFDQMWYKDIGGPLMITMLINTVAPVAVIFGREMTASLNRCWGRCTAFTQKSLNDAYMGPEFDIATRYGEVLMCVTVTMMYGSGMPLLYAFACFFCLVISFFDKRFMLRVCRRPPRYGTDLAEFAMAVAPWAAQLHMLVGMWMHTHFETPNISKTVGAGRKYISDAAVSVGRRCCCCCCCVCVCVFYFSSFCVGVTSRSFFFIFFHLVSFSLWCGCCVVCEQGEAECGKSK